MKELQAFHVVLTTHNSRVSERMIKYNIQRGVPVELTLDIEIMLTKIISLIIKENGFKILAYNICKDHIHIMPVCEYEELPKMIQKIKSVSSKLFRRQIDGNSVNLDHTGTIGIQHLWSQKFYRGMLDEWELSTYSNRPGLIYKSSHLRNAIDYIRSNRAKHGLQLSDELEKLISEFVTTEEIAYGIIE